VSAFEAFSSVRDPRIERCKLHPLMNVLVMALSGSLAGATGWDELAMFAKGHLKFFEEFLSVPNGAPSADTFRRVFEVLNPRELEVALRQWVARVSKSFDGEVVAIDGKALRGAIETAGSTTPLHMLHVWATRQGLLLAQQRVDGAPGEIAAIPEVLKRVCIKGAIVTTDANNCTQAITSAIREAGAEYVLALKGNRRFLHKDVVELFNQVQERKFRGTRVHRSSNKGHGREERRVVRAMTWHEAPAEWADLQSIVMVDRTRTIAGESSSERSYYITSMRPEPEALGRAIRDHWGIENNLHWVLDVAFDEDSRKIRHKTSAENFAVLARLALMMLKRSPAKLSINLKRKNALWNADYLRELLVGGIPAI
jgi:predicted transposase YbfD/YdcC